ncbi:hypothetical protein CAPTEDRAFT_167288, partial [Capitella teleta]
MWNIINFSFLLGLLSFRLSSVSAESHEYDALYNSAVEAYLQQRWYECKAEMENAINAYNTLKQDLVQCRVTCNYITSEIDAVQYLELSFLDTALQRSNCLRRCFEKHDVLGVSDEVKDAFARRLPYDYLQICAFKTGDLELAVSSAYTFIVANPDHEIMQSNIKFYQEQNGVDPTWFKDLESKLYQKYYSSAVASYSAFQWHDVIQFMEEAVQDFLQEEGRCQRSCEGTYDHESLTHFYIAIAGLNYESRNCSTLVLFTDHWINVLQCQVNCEDEISIVNGLQIKNMLAEMYHYLQFAYYKVHDLTSAAACTETALALKPQDEAMLKNKAFYQKQGMDKEDFSTRKEISSYIEARSLLLSQLNFIRTKYKFSEADLDVKDIEQKDEEESPIFMNNAGVVISGSSYPNPLTNASLFGTRDSAFLAQLGDFSSKRGLTIVMENEELEGKYRVATDGFLTSEQCHSLMNLAGVRATKGDGYQNESPHTKFEKYEGLTINRAAQLAIKDSVSLTEAQQFLNITETARTFLETYYNLQIPLHFHYTHLVCRTALSDEAQNGRHDLSHPVHSDNCYMQKDGTCLREAPAYVQRDFSGIIYLNDDFEGGNFFFANRDDSVQKTIRPKCGRMVAFESSDFHGVLPVTKGRRCAIAVWYTLDPLAKEGSHEAAQQLLAAKVSRDQKLANADLRHLLNEHDFSLVKTEVELNGPERFAADGILNEQQCKALMKLANQGAIVGDGYNAGKKPTAQTSPHTNHEYFAGLRIDRAAELAADGTVDASAVDLYLNSSAMSLDFVKKYFDM